MWRNFFHVAFRNLSKNRIFSFINIAGLAIGLASAILIILFIAKEISFDRFNDKSDRLYRVYIDGKVKDQTFKGSWTSYTLAPTVTREIDEIENYVRLEVYPQQLIWHNDVKVVEDNVVFADSSFFRIFSIALQKGDKDDVLRKPNSVVITTEKARQYFGNEDPLGKTLEFNTKGNYYVVTGVMDEFPDNSHFYCDFLLSMSNIAASRSDDWLFNSIYSYVLLKPDANVSMVQEKMNEVLLKNLRIQLKDIFDISLEEWNEDGSSLAIYLQAITDIHLNPDIENGSELCFRPVNDKKYISVFSLVAFFILLIASMNFMNLSTARSAMRAREIAMRKVVGSQRSVLIKQFLSESVLLTLMALIIALFIVEVSLPWFNRSMGLSLNFYSLGKGIIIPGVVLLAILVGLLSGIYPALYLSKYQPLKGLRGGHLKGKHSAMFRSVMVIAQFTISVAIIIGTLIVAKQVDFLLNMDPGFRDHDIVVLDRIYPLNNKLQTFCAEVEKIPGVKKVSSSSTYLGFSNLSSAYQLKDRDRSSNFMFDVNYVDPDFFETYGLKLVKGEGRFFSKKDANDTMTCIINETAVKEFELKNPLEAVIVTPGGEGEEHTYKVIGVVEDFHHSTLRKPISPYLFRYKTDSYSQAGYISICFEEKSVYFSKTLKKINLLWSKMTKDEPFQYFFLDSQLDKYYIQEARIGKISLLFSFLAILIACLGLFGLTMFNTERRLREISIRKAMGAGIWSLLMIISKEILGLLAISILLAWIIAYFFMDHWLSVFPYNIGFTPWLYLFAALASFLIAMITVNSITLRAAMKNPVKSLYHE